MKRTLTVDDFQEKVDLPILIALIGLACSVAGFSIGIIAAIIVCVGVVVMLGGFFAGVNAELKRTLSSLSQVTDQRTNVVGAATDLAVGKAVKVNLADFQRVVPPDEMLRATAIKTDEGYTYFYTPEGLVALSVSKVEGEPEKPATKRRPKMGGKTLFEQMVELSRENREDPAKENKKPAPRKKAGE